MRRIVFAEAALCGLLWTGLATPATDALPEILVTARKVAEAVDRIPLAVDVIGAEQIGAGRIDGLQALALAAPGLYFESFWGGRGDTPVLRGQAQPSAAGDNVGIFVDDIYQAARSSINVMPLDMERIEVARGPQNTLFGRSTFSGAVLFVPREPTESPGGHLRTELGTDGLAGIEGAWSQPLWDTGWRLRAALGHRQADGTLRSLSGESLDDRRQDAATLTLARKAAATDEWQMRITARYQRGRFSHPPTSTLDGGDYNCGALDTESQLWSYYCGEVPVAAEYDPSPGLPASRNQSGQVALHAGRDFGGNRLSALIGYYGASSRSVRDFDASTSGLPLGVCTIGVNCPLGGPPAPLTRLASPDVVSLVSQEAREWSFELRLQRDAGPGIGWLFGISAWDSRLDESTYFGVDRDGLGAADRLTALLAATPELTGPLSPLNAAVVDDSRDQQVQQARNLIFRTGAAAFGVLDVPLGAHSSLRTELRAEFERERIDPLVAGFRPFTGEKPPRQDFSVLTPRVSLDRRLGENWYAYASVARGARSGGTNPVPGLDPEEQGFDPEYNWTSELGVRYSGPGAIASWNATAFHIDWRATQIAGIATTPGINNLVTHNTGGIRTPGIETGVTVRIAQRLLAQVGFSATDPRYIAGSDDPGSRVFCGLTARPPTSDFCAYGPPRTPTNGLIRLVPYIDDRNAGRAPRQSGTASLQLAPQQLGQGWEYSGMARFSWQQSVFERPINGAWYGERQLLDASLSLARGDLRLTLWGNNLTDERYVRSAASRGGAFYPFLPRPLDFLYGEGRRIGLSVSLDLAAVQQHQ